MPKNNSPARKQARRESAQERMLSSSKTDLAAQEYEEYDPEMRLLYAIFGRRLPEWEQGAEQAQREDWERDVLAQESQYIGCYDDCPSCLAADN